MLSSLNAFVKSVYRYCAGLAHLVCAILATVNGIFAQYDHIFFFNAYRHVPHYCSLMSFRTQIGKILDRTLMSFQISTDELLDSSLPSVWTYIVTRLVVLDDCHFGQAMTQ